MRQLLVRVKIWKNYRKATKELAKVKNELALANKRISELEFELANSKSDYENKLLSEKKTKLKAIADIRNNYEKIIQKDREYHANLNSELIKTIVEAKFPEKEVQISRNSIAHSPLEEKEDEFDSSFSLDFFENKLFLDRKDQFFAEGEELGKDSTTIEIEWEKVKSYVIKDIKKEYSPFDLEA